MHVKVFEAPSAADLEQAVNGWLRQHAGATINHVVQSVRGHNLVLTIFYLPQ